MSTILRIITGILLAAGCATAATNQIPNRLIDYRGFQVQVKDVGTWREQHRITEEQFLQMSADPTTVILDARSADKYKLLHIHGAKCLPLTDFTAVDLARVIPAKTTRVLIYCNNNFLNSPVAFASKAPSASLNIYTMNSLASYGYTNVYELGPLLDVHKTKLPLEGSDKSLRR